MTDLERALVVVRPSELIFVRRWAVERAMALSRPAIAASEVIREAAVLAGFVLCGLSFDDGQDAGEQRQPLVHAVGPSADQGVDPEHLVEELQGDNFGAVAVEAGIGHGESSVGCVATSTVGAAARVGNDPAAVDPAAPAPEPAA